MFREKADNVKQGSKDEATIPYSLDPLHNYALECYNNLLRIGVCPEQARMVLPQSMYTEWYWTGSLAAWARVCKLRLDPHTQKETRDIAHFISNKMSIIFPVSWSALLA
jgi:thymidylate synthase (FAD)